MSLSVLVWEITKKTARRRDAVLMADMLSWRGPFGGKYTIQKIGRAYEARAIVSEEALDSGQVAEIVGATYGSRTLLWEGQ